MRPTAMMMMMMNCLPTRYNLNTGTTTLIDNIFTNHIDNNTSGIFTNEISDHPNDLYILQ